MLGSAATLVAVVLSATIDVAAGAPLGPALARAQPGDVVRLGPGVHPFSLGQLSGVSVEGAGPGATEVRPPEGEDAAVVVGDAGLARLTLRAGPERCGLQVSEGGTARVSDAVLAGGSCGAAVRGRLEASDVELRGGRYGLLASRGEAIVRGGSARGGQAGVAVLGGTTELHHLAVVGPSREAGVSVAGGRARLVAVAVRATGPSGITVTAGTLEAEDVLVSDIHDEHGPLGDCVLAHRSTLRLARAALVRCGGTAVGVVGGEATLTGVDATGGAAGCLVLMDEARAELVGNVCSGRGPSVVATEGARATARMNQWRTDPTLWIDCGAGSRVELGPGEAGPQPCARRP